jgi:parvulin-like peptidyl-prolyl isomerase
MARSTASPDPRQESRRDLSPAPRDRSGMLGRVLRAMGRRVRAGRAARRLAAMSLVAASLCSAVACQPSGSDAQGSASDHGAVSTRPPESEAAATSVQQTPPDAAGRTPRTSERWAPYPPGRWRLAPSKELEPVVIWVSHLLVRHAQAADEESFSFTHWRSVAPSVRSREEALDRAKKLAEQAKRQPERFAELARLQSDDITNREQGGSLGGLRASQLLFWPQVLDAFAAIRPGEVSDPVETRFGFHVFLRQAPPAEEMMSGQHIVISHDRAMWSRMTTCKDELPTRTREEALRLATQIFHTLQPHPESFADAVQRYSEDCDAAVGGDFGRWSTREVAPFERRLDVLRSLATGETAPPRETHVGFEIIRRTPERPRQRLAARLISIRFDPWAAAPEPNSRTSALRNALQAARALDEDPAVFGELQSRYCCAGASVWEEGREPPPLRSILGALKPGEISSQPVRASGAYVLAMKLDPSLVGLPSPSSATLELPSAERVTLQSLLALLPSDAARETLARLSRESAGAVGLSAALAGQLGALLASGATTSDALLPQQLEAELEQSRALLTDDVYARYRAALEEGLAQSVLSRRMPMF